MTPTDVAGWIALAPWALLAFLALLGVTGLLENTQRGRDIVDRLIDRIEDGR